MRLLLDTNILVFLSKDPTLKSFEKIIGTEVKKVFISIVTIGELRSMAIQNDWGDRRLRTIDMIFNRVATIEINDNLIGTYAEIDAYSQRRNPRMTDYPFATPRNMGKNDLWIAATASLLGLKLVTTDADFSHLHQAFLEVQVLKPELFKSK